MEQSDDKSAVMDDEIVNTPYPLSFPEDVSDQRLLNAVTNAVKLQTMTPLIKEELRCTILSRRHAEGKTDIDYSEKKPKVKKVYTEQEKQRKLRRQEQNRRAAQRCRQKKKEREVTVLQEYYEQRDINSNLNDQLQILQKEKSDLEKIVKTHIEVCAWKNINQNVEQDNGIERVESTYIVEQDNGIERVESTYIPEKGTSLSDYNEDAGIERYTSRQNTATEIDHQHSPSFDFGTNTTLDNHYLQSTFLNIPQYVDSISFNTKMNNTHANQRTISESSNYSQIECIDGTLYNDVDKTPDFEKNANATKTKCFDTSCVKDDDFEIATNATHFDTNYKEDYLETILHCENHKSFSNHWLIGKAGSNAGSCEIIDSSDTLFMNDKDKSILYLDTSVEMKPFMQMCMESEMDIRRNYGERGASCSSVEELDTRRNDRERGVSCSSVEELELSTNVDLTSFLEPNTKDEHYNVGDDVHQSVFI